jgi:hypothetical protein
MSLEAELPMVRQIEVQRPVVDLVAPGAAALPPSPEQAQAADQVFARHGDQPDAVAGALWLTSAGMLLHDLVQDTLAAPADEEEDEGAPKKKPAPPPEQ